MRNILKLLFITGALVPALAYGQSTTNVQINSSSTSSSTTSVNGEETSSESEARMEVESDGTTTEVRTVERVVVDGEEQKNEEDTMVFCTADAKQCPDGSYVGRDPENDCAFYSCPGDGGSVAGCARDLKQCPDGSAVSRDWNNQCAFHPCPGEEKTQIDPPSLQLDAGPQDTTVKGNVEAEWKVEEGEKVDEQQPADDVMMKDESDEGADSMAKKPKEIVVVGSTVRQESNVEFSTEIKAGIVEDENDLREYARYVTRTDYNVEKVIVTDDVVALDYRYPARLFGIIDVLYTATTEVDNEGRVKIRYPWWLALTKHTADAIETNTEDALQSVEAEGELELVAIQQRRLEVLSAVSKAVHDSAMSVIRKIGG